MSESATLTFQNVSFNFGKSQAVNDFSLEVKSGSFTTLLGPSGCGKTTLLRLVSGFLKPSSGKIFIDGADQENIPAEKRQIGMVFQDYALFPHLTVEQNLLYGLEIKTRAERNALNATIFNFGAGDRTSLRKQLIDKNIARIHKTARILGIADLLERYPHQLSGGQQQRVALGRALVLEPKILLMDEPLSSLDAKLRTQVREELKEIQSQVGITTLYVTHDQEEALSLSDSIAVLNHGKLLQTGSPREIYFNPTDEFVADFVGRANFVTLDGKRVAVRPEWFQKTDAPGENTISGSILSASFLGQTTRYRVRLDDGSSAVITADFPTGDEQTSAEANSRIYLKVLRSLDLNK